jgi:hypothetical protein
MAARKEGPPPMTAEQLAYYTRMGKKGGAKGGHQAALNMTPEQRKERARKAALARWRRKRKA